MKASQLSIEILALLGVENPGTVAAAEIRIAAGKLPSVTVSRWVKTLEEKPARVLHSKTFDLVPADEPRDTTTLGDAAAGVAVRLEFP